MDFRTSYRAVTYNGGATWLVQRKRWWLPVWLTAAYMAGPDHAVPFRFADPAAALVWCKNDATRKSKAAAITYSVFGRLP